MSAADTSGYLPRDSASTRCAEGPDRCMDDLCRGSDVGMCGALSDRLLGIRDDEGDWSHQDDAE